MIIQEVRTFALRGATHDHGWPGGTDPNVQYNTLVEIVTDQGLSGIGSCYTTRGLVEASLELLRPHLIGETASQFKDLDIAMTSLGQHAKTLQIWREMSQLAGAPAGAAQDFLGSM